MFIKSMTIEGFKSYRNRVEIKGFDPQFNAITGPNGTGKSNILDAVSFALGITNLPTLRATTHQDLIYMFGQHGVTQAAVSIVFDNRDKRQSPLSYKKCDEITVTRQLAINGKSKYLINGLKVRNKRVSDLFCSLQLNVNNPNFLIMQGCITKVLNMKPPEILSMVEEAADTMRYDTEKQLAQSTIEKKDSELRELNDVLKARTQHQEYTNVVNELETLEKLYVAYKYVSAEENAEKAQVKLAEVKRKIETQKETIKNNEKEVKDLEKRVLELKRKLDAESGRILQELKTELQAIQNSEDISRSNHKAATEAVASQDKKVRLLNKALAEDQTALQAKKKILKEFQESSTSQALKTASEKSRAALAEAKQHYCFLIIGGEISNLNLQLTAANKEAFEASTRIHKSAMELQHAEQRLKTLECEWKQYQSDQESIGKKQATVDQLEAKLSRISFNKERYTELKNMQRSLRRDIRAKRDRVENLASGGCELALQELKEGERLLESCTAELRAMQPTAEDYQRYDMMCRELEVTKAFFAITPHAQTRAEIESLREQVSQLAHAEQRDKITQNKTQDRARVLRAKLKDLEEHRERNLKKAKIAMEKARLEVEKDRLWSAREQEHERLLLQVTEAENAVATSRRKLAEAVEKAERLKQSLEQADEEHSRAIEAEKQMQGRIKLQNAEIAGRSTEISQLLRRKKKLGKANNELGLRIRYLRLKLKEVQAEAVDCERRIRSMSCKYPWILIEKKSFGAPGGMYDFQAMQAHRDGQRLEQLREKRNELSRGVTLLDKEEQYQDVLRKKQIVEADRAKLVTVIEELDEEKKVTLQSACAQVNKDFGSILSALLPGAQAMLKPPDGRTELDGLEVKVGLNNTWRESLGELSAGERSLVALSLELAILRFKPTAPLYLLDEVDTVLDWSHAYNFGQVLKKHFKTSQFIIVSVKSELIKNADVLFRTRRYVGGEISAIERTVRSRRIPQLTISHH